MSRTSFLITALSFYLFVLPGCRIDKPDEPEIKPDPEFDLTLLYAGTFSTDGIGAGDTGRFFINEKSLFLPLGINGLTILDITAPENLSSYQNMNVSLFRSNQPIDVTVFNGRTYIALTPSGEIQEWDLSDMKNVRYVKSAGTIDRLQRLTSTKNCLVASSMTDSQCQSVYTGTYSNTNVSLIESWTGEPLTQIFADNSSDFVFLGQEFTGKVEITILSFTNPSKPTEFEPIEMPNPSNIMDIHVSSDKMVVAGNSGGLFVFDIEDKTSCSLIATKSWNDSHFFVLAVAANYPYIMAGISNGHMGVNKWLFCEVAKSGEISVIEEFLCTGRPHQAVFSDSILALGETIPTSAGGVQRIITLYETKKIPR